MTTEPLTIGELVKASGVGVQAIRFYERKGLLPAPGRSASGYREFGADDASRIRFIKRAQDLGFTLREIQELLELNTAPRATCSDIKKRADHKIAEVEAKIRDLQRMRRSLRTLSDACGESRRAASQCRILTCFETGWNCD